MGKPIVLAPSNAVIYKQEVHFVLWAVVNLHKGIESTAFYRLKGLY